MALHVAVFSVRVSEQSVMHRSLCSQNPCVFHSHMFRTSGTESILLRSFPMSRHKQTVQLFEPTILPQSLCSALSSAYPFSSSSMSPHHTSLARQNEPDGAWSSATWVLGFAIQTHTYAPTSTSTSMRPYVHMCTCYVPCLAFVPDSIEAPFPRSFSLQSHEA